MPFRFVQIHSAQRDLTEEEEEKDHREFFMAQLLAHNRRCSDPSIRDKIVEKLVDIVIFLDKQIWDARGEAVPVGTDFMEQGQNKRLGSCGLPLHYANIINHTENIIEFVSKVM